MLTTFTRGRLLVDILLFVGTTVLLAFLAQNLEWFWFWVVAVACALLFTLLKFAETRPVLEFLDARAKREHRLSIAFDRFGVRDLYNTQVDAEAAERNKVTGEIIDRGTDFALSGSTGASYLDPKMHRHWPHVRAKLTDGCRFRLLLTDPYSEAKRIRNELNGVSSEIDPKLDLDNLALALVRYPKLEVRFTDQVYCSVFFTESEMIYDPYHLGQVYDRLENRFFALRLDDKVEVKGASYYRQLKGHFDYLWEAGTAWDGFRAAHPHLFAKK